MTELEAVIEVLKNRNGGDLISVDRLLEICFTARELIEDSENLQPTHDYNE